MYNLWTISKTSSLGCLQFLFQSWVRPECLETQFGFAERLREWWHPQLRGDPLPPLFVAVFLPEKATWDRRMTPDNQFVSAWGGVSTNKNNSKSGMTAGMMAKTTNLNWRFHLSESQRSKMVSLATLAWPSWRSWMENGARREDGGVWTGPIEQKRQKRPPKGQPGDKGQVPSLPQAANSAFLLAQLAWNHHSQEEPHSGVRQTYTASNSLKLPVPPQMTTKEQFMSVGWIWITQLQSNSDIVKSSVAPKIFTLSKHHYYIEGVLCSKKSVLIEKVIYYRISRVIYYIGVRLYINKQHQQLILSNKQ